MNNTNDPNLILNLPEDLLIALHAIADERKMRTEELIQGTITEYFEDLNRKPPTVGYIVKQLRNLQTQYEELKVRHISLFGSMVNGTATRRSDINLLFDIEGNCPSGQWWEIWRLTYDQFGKKYIINPVFKNELNPEKLEAISKDVVKVF